jgi:WD40 repeat protein
MRILFRAVPLLAVAVIGCSNAQPHTASNGQTQQAPQPQADPSPRMLATQPSRRATLLAPNGVFSPDGKLLLLIYGYQAGIGPGFDGPPPNYHRFCVFDVDTGKQIQAFDGPYNCEGVLLCSDCKSLLSAEYEGPLRLWDASSGKIVRNFDVDSKGIQLLLAMCPIGGIALLVHPSHGLELWDTNAGTSLRALESVERMGNVQKGKFSPDGKRVFASFAPFEESGVTAVWDVASGTVRLAFRGGEEWKYPLAFAPEGTFAISEYIDREGKEQPRLVLWDWTDGREVRRFDPHPALARAVAFTGDGKSVVSMDNDGMIRRWGLESGKEQAHFSLGKAPPGACALTPDGSVAFTASGKQGGSRAGNTLSIRLWDTATGKVLHSFAEPELP